MREILGLPADWQARPSKARIDRAISRAFAKYGLQGKISGVKVGRKPGWPLDFIHEHRQKQPPTTFDQIYLEVRRLLRLVPRDQRPKAMSLENMRSSYYGSPEYAERHNQSI